MLEVCLLSGNFAFCCSCLCSAKRSPKPTRQHKYFHISRNKKYFFSAATTNCRENPFKYVKSIQSSTCSNMLKIMNQPLQLMQFSAQISNFAFCKPLPSAEFKPFMCKPPSFKSSVLRQSQGQSMPHIMYVLTYTTGLN